MKIILYSGENVIDTIQSVDNVQINGNDITWETGSMSGVKCSFLVLNDNEDFSINGVLDSARKNKIEELDKACSETILNYFPFDVNGVTYYFSNDMEAQANFEKAGRAFDKAYITNITWTAYNQNDIAFRLTFDSVSFDNLYLAHLHHIQDNISKFRDVLEPQVLSATTIEELDSIKW